MSDCMPKAKMPLKERRMVGHSVYLTIDEAQKLEEVAISHKISISDVIRLFIQNGLKE